MNEGEEGKRETVVQFARGESQFSVRLVNEHEDERRASHPLEADDDDENLSLTSRRVFLLPQRNRKLRHCDV